LWPDASEAEHRVEIEAFLAGHSREPLAVLVAAERWAREQGCTEFASDAKPDNELSTRAHHALGFEDAGLIRCFRKSLAGRL
jgi:L-amino acid N-acyltransferase YncA